MTVYIDPPLWPAHGTMFSHLVSDASLEELHAFAAAAGVSERAFDRDHYDVPAFRHTSLVAAGAVPVSGGDLVRRLEGSGLRVPAQQRPEKLRPVLMRRWARLKHHNADTRLWQSLGLELLDRWDEPHRHYHSLPHLTSVLRTVALLEREGELPQDRRRAVLLAAWFHDAVYVGAAGRDEEDAAQLAEQRLVRLVPDSVVAEAARLVRLTAGHCPEPGDPSGAVMVDADLEVLGREPAAYRRYVQLVRADYAHVPDDQFAAGRAQVLRHLLETPRLFRTATGYRRWEAGARQNMEQELHELARGTGLRTASL